MFKPEDFYQAQLLQYEERLGLVKKRLNTSSTLRILLFLLIVFGIYGTWGQTQIVVPIAIVGVAVFVGLLLRHNKLAYERKLLEALVHRNEKELKVLAHDYHELPSGTEYADPSHFFSQDIDLFGRGSFYQYLNRTALESGSKKLVQLLLSNDIQDIGQKQEAIRELSAMPEWRQRFGAIATLVKTDRSADVVVKWLEDYRAFVPKRMKFWSIAFSTVSIGSLLLFFFGLLSGYWVLAFFSVGMTITGKFFRRIGKLAAHLTQIQNTFAQYAKLLQEIEAQDFSSALLLKAQDKVKGKTVPSSKTLHRFSRLLDALDQRNNIFMGILGNGLLLRDLFVCKSIEEWILQHRSLVPQWFGAIVIFDAYNSLGNYAFNHPHHVYPTLVSEGKVLGCEQLEHPLLDPDTSIANDFHIDDKVFFIVTGANMAGKSTFLRTVSLAIMMANVGLPVCAKKVAYRPVKLITSMRTSDSLVDDESYFFSELKRLKFIVDTLKEEPHFIVLDEILKGTNSLDKEQGSKRFVQRLVHLKATGIIATHDLGLCELADGSNTIENIHFDAEIVNDELMFDYSLKPGVCQNMNASFLLRKMGVVN